MQTPAEGTPRLIVLRGNSGSGKSTTARALRERFGHGIAWVEQDYLRRILLREHDVPGGVNIGLIDQTVRYALDHGFHVILEGILGAARYGPMLQTLHSDYAARAGFFYFDISFDETVRRHHGRPQATAFSPDEMRDWYRPRDLLPFVDEEIIPEASRLDETVARVMAKVALLDAGVGQTSPG